MRLPHLRCRPVLGFALFSALLSATSPVLAQSMLLLQSATLARNSAGQTVSTRVPLPAQSTQSPSIDPIAPIAPPTPVIVPIITPTSGSSSRAKPVDAAPSQRWLAHSRTAMAITGDIQLGAQEITFASGEHLTLTPLPADEAANAGNTTNSDAHQALYRINGKSHPVLEHGNTLCADELPTYLGTEVRTTPSGPRLILSFFLDNDAYANPPTPCATYSYILP